MQVQLHPQEDREESKEKTLMELLPKWKRTKTRYKNRTMKFNNFKRE